MSPGSISRVVVADKIALIHRMLDGTQIASVRKSNAPRR
jgi:hypothetical protein